jgi:serine/threonine protein kinase
MDVQPHLEPADRALLEPFGGGTGARILAAEQMGGRLDHALEGFPIRSGGQIAPDQLPDLVGFPPTTRVEQVRAVREQHAGVGLGGRSVRWATLPGTPTRTRQWKPGDPWCRIAHRNEVYRAMQLDDIKASVRPAMRDQIDGLFGDFSQELGTGDLDRFVSWLHDRGLISAQTFRGLHAGGKLVLTSVETLSGSTYYPDEGEREELLDDIAGVHVRQEQEVGDSQRFQYLGKLAAGAMGEILIVRDRELQRKVALKRMHGAIAKRAKLARRFLNEAQITAQLDHPNIVPVYTLDSSKDKPLSYTMKLIRGSTFAQLVRDTQEFYDDNRPMDDDHELSVRLDHFVRACDALAYAHSRGVVHRDLKPENIMVGAYGEVYVMDWGIARIMGTKEESHEDIVELGSATVHQTRFGAVLGTPAYMSPEQAAGLNDLLDGRSDGFSLGLILYELVCLRPAVSGSDTMAILDRMQDASLDPVVHYSPREVIAPELVAIIQKATARHPDGRYQTVKELAEDVRRFQRGEPVRALPEGIVQRVYRWISRHRELVVAVVMFGFLFFGGIAIVSLAATLSTMRRATEREQQISSLLSEVSRRGHIIDTKFQGYQALLRMLAATALEASGREPDALGGVALGRGRLGGRAGR